MNSRMEASEDGIHAVQRLCWRQGDEKLRSVGVGTGVGHGEDARAGVFQRWFDLVLEVLSVDGRSSSARARRISALDDEIFDHSMELRGVVIPSPSQFGEVPTGVRRLVPIQLHHQISHSEKEKREKRMRDRRSTGSDERGFERDEWWSPVVRRNG